MKKEFENMKFAQVTAYARNGKIWDGSKEKPNYLCDSSEMDQTSLGCWTSALKGEHIPLSWLAMRGWSRGIYHRYLAPSAKKLYPVGYSVVSKWLLKCFDKFRNLKYLKKFDVVLAVVHDYDIREMAELVSEIKEMDGRPLVLGALCNTLYHFREAFKESEKFADFKKFIDNCDLFINYYHDALSGYLGLFTDTPIVNFPYFYPYEFTKTQHAPREEKEKIIFVSGDTQKTDNVASLLVAKKIQERRPDFIIEVVERVNTNFEPLEGANYKKVPFLKWIDYLKHTRRVYMIIDMDNTWTFGRVPRDAAAVGTPCVGVNSGSQTALFPDLVCSDVAGMEKAVDLGIKLIEDEKFYKMVQNQALKKLEEYSYENSIEKLEKLVENFNRRGNEDDGHSR